MARVISSLSISLDGFIAAPNDNRDQPLGDNGKRLHEWMSHGENHEILDELVQSAGAVVMGRRSYDQCEGPGGWGDGGPLGKSPCFVLTHRVPQEIAAPSVFTFVTDGIEHAIEQAKAAAGDQYVGLHGASTAQQCVNAGLLDEIQLHLVPIFLGGGVRLLDQLDPRTVELERTRVVEAPGVTHLRFRVVK